MEWCLCVDSAVLRAHLIVCLIGGQLRMLNISFCHLSFNYSYCCNCSRQHSVVCSNIYSLLFSFICITICQYRTRFDIVLRKIFLCSCLSSYFDSKVLDAENSPACWHLCHPFCCKYSLLSLQYTTLKSDSVIYY